MFRVIIGALVVSVCGISFATPTIEVDSNRLALHELAKENHHPDHSYRRAREFVMQELDLRRDDTGYYVKDVYCQQKFRSKVGPESMPNPNRINIEHTWPRSRFGGSKKSSLYRIKEADLHHLFPSNSRANSIRGHYLFTQFTKSGYNISDCSLSKSGYVPELGGDAFEPPMNHKGNVARALFYFAVRYNMKISDYEEFFLRQWNVLDPVDEAEMERNDNIQAIQGNRNPFIDDSSLVHDIIDF